MTFEEGPFVGMRGQSVRDLFAAVPLPPTNDIKQKLTLLLGCADDVNQTVFIVEIQDTFRERVTRKGAEGDSNAIVTTVEHEGKMRDEKIQSKRERLGESTERGSF